MLALGGLGAAFILTILIAASSSIFADGGAGHVAAMGAVAVDRPTLFIQGTILRARRWSACCSSPRRSHDGSARSSPQAAAVPGSAEEREGLLAGVTHTEVYPLTLFAVGGMLLFPAANDLLTMFVGARGAVAAAVPAVRAGPAPPPAVAGGGGEVLPARRVLVGVLPVRHRDALRLRGLGAAVAPSPRRPRTNTANETLLLAGIALLGVGLLFKIGAVPFQAWKPDVYQGAPTPITALMAVLHGGRPRSARCCACFYVAFGEPDLGLAAGDVGRRDPHHARRRDHRHHPDRREADAGLLLHRARRLHPDRGHRRERGSACPAACSTSSRTGSARSARSP